MATNVNTERVTAVRKNFGGGSGPRCSSLLIPSHVGGVATTIVQQGQMSPVPSRSVGGSSQKTKNLMNRECGSITKAVKKMADAMIGIGDGMMGGGGGSSMIPMLTTQMQQQSSNQLLFQQQITPQMNKMEEQIHSKMDKMEQRTKTTEKYLKLLIKSIKKTCLPQ